MQSSNIARTLMSRAGTSSAVSRSLFARGAFNGLLNLVATPTQLSPCQPQARTMATKKVAGSSTNGRSTIGRRLGWKVWPESFAIPGNILIRQRGARYKAGLNVGMGRDHTIFAKEAGIVKLTTLPRNKKRKVVHIIPKEEIENFDQIMLDHGYTGITKEELREQRRATRKKGRFMRLYL